MMTLPEVCYCKTYGHCVEDFSGRTCSPRPEGFSAYNCSDPHFVPLCVNGKLPWVCLNDDDDCKNKCVEKEKCECNQWMSTLEPQFNFVWGEPSDPALYESHINETKHMFKNMVTGWTGSNCSIPICVQANHFDPFCEGVTFGAKGCFRCKNGGTCTAPDVCTCPPDWTGVDCSIPVCKIEAENLLELGFSFNWKNLEDLMSDPCQTQKKVPYSGTNPLFSSYKSLNQGVCSFPGVCTCLCTNRAYLINGEYESLPVTSEKDPPPGYTYATKNCISGYEGFTSTGEVNDGLFFESERTFQSCHLKILDSESSEWGEHILMTTFRLLIIVMTSVFAVVGIIFLAFRIIKITKARTLPSLRQVVSLTWKSLSLNSLRKLFSRLLHGSLFLLIESVKRSAIVCKLLAWVLVLLLLQYTLVFIPISTIYPNFSADTSLNETLRVGEMDTKFTKIFSPEGELIIVCTLVSVYTLFFVLVSIEPFKMYTNYEDRLKSPLSLSRRLGHLLIRVILYTCSHFVFRYTSTAISGTVLYKIFHNSEALSCLLNAVFVIITTPLYEHLIFGINVMNMTKMKLFLLVASLVSIAIYYVVWKGVWVLENKIADASFSHEYFLVPMLNYVESSFCKLFFCFIAKKMTFDTVLTEQKKVNRDAAFAVHAFGQCFASVLKRIAILRLVAISEDYKISLAILSSVSCGYEIFLRLLNRTIFPNMASSFLNAISEGMGGRTRNGFLKKFTRKIQPVELKEGTRMVKWDKRIHRFRSTMITAGKIEPFKQNVDGHDETGTDVDPNDSTDSLHPSGNSTHFSGSDENLEAQVVDSKRIFWAKYIVMDMFAEYYAICIIPLLYMSALDHPFTTDAYIDHYSIMYTSKSQRDDIWEHGSSINLDFLTSWLVIQFAEEVISDSVSIAVEIKHGYPIHLAFETIFCKRTLETIKVLFCVTSVLSILLFVVPLYSFYRWNGAFVEAAIRATNETGYDFQNICCNLGHESTSIYLAGSGPREEYCYNYVAPLEYLYEEYLDDDHMFYYEEEIYRTHTTRRLNVSRFLQQCMLKDENE